MDWMLELQLLTKYPKILENYHKSVYESTMGWGCECGDGWYPLLDETFSKLEKLDGIVLDQVKEKFGCLRIYFSGSGRENFELADKYVQKAEFKSRKICEVCGEPGEMRGGGWLKVRCDKCHNEEKRIQD